MEADWAFTVIPRCFSTGNLSKTCSFLSVEEIVPKKRRTNTYFKNQAMCLDYQIIFSIIVYGSEMGI